MAQLGATITSKNIWGFDPRSISGCSLWLDGADPNTIFSDVAGTTLATNGGTVGQWKDKSVFSNNATQSTAGNRPTYTSSANALAFVSGSTKYFSLASAANLPTGSSNATYFTVSALTAANATGVYTILSHGTNADSQARTIIDRLLNTTFGIVIGTITQGVTTSGPNAAYNPSLFVPTVPHINAIQLNNYKGSGWYTGNVFNNTAQDLEATTNPINTASTTAYIGNTLIGGGTSPYNGNIYEIIVYNSAISNTERQQVEGYLAWKYGIQQYLPSNHPYYNSLISYANFNPTFVPGCALWLDGSDSSTITTSGSNIVQWNDKSGNGYNATPLASGSNNILGSPTYSSSPTGVLFTSGSSSSGQGLVCNLSASTAVQSGFVVLYDTNLSPGYRGSIIGGSASGSSASGGRQWGIMSNQQQMSNGGILGGQNATLSAFSSNIGLLTFVDSGSTPLAYYQFGTSVTPSGTYNGTYAASRITTLGCRGGGLGYSEFLNGIIIEFISYNVVLTTAQRQQVEGYLAWKYGLLSKLPSTHPYYSSNYIYKSLKPFARNFVPTDISNCIVWLDASDKNTITLTGSNVTQWNDKSGQGNNFTNGGSTLTYTSTLNGLNVISGTASSYNNSLTSSALTRDGFNHTYFYVLKYPASGTSAIRLIQFGNEFFGHSGTTTPYLENNANDGRNGTVYWFYTTGAPFASSDAFFGGNTFICGCVRQNGVYTLTSTGNSASGNSNGVGTSNGGASIPNVTSGSYFISVSGTTALIAEVIIYNGALTVPERQQVEGYLAWRWGLRSGVATSPASYGFPTTHPYYKHPPPAITQFKPSTKLYKPNFLPQDLLPVVWIDPQDSSTYTVDANNRILTIANKGTGSFNQAFNITGIASNVLTVSSTTYLSIGQAFYVYISGATGLTSGTTYYVLTVPSSSTITISATFNGSRVTGLTYVSTSTCYVNPSFTIPLAGTGSGITGPLLTQSNVGYGYGQQYLDFSNGGNFLVNYGAISGTTLTLNTAIPHAIPAGAQITLSLQTATYNGGGSALTNIGPYQVIYGTIVGNTTLNLLCDTSHGIAIGGSLTIQVNSANFNGGSSASALARTYTIPANLTPSVSSTSGNNITLSSSTGLSLYMAITFGTSFGSIVSGTTYYIISLSGAVITVATTPTGTAVSAGSSGSGTTSIGTGGRSLMLTISSSTNGIMVIYDMNIINNIGIVGPYLIPANLTPSVSSTSGNNITLSSGTGVMVNQFISFGSSFGSIVSGTTYYILSVAGAVITVALTIGGAAVSAGGSGSGTTSIGTGGQAIMLTTYSALTSGTMTINSGRVEYGSLPITSANVTSATSLTVYTAIAHGLSSGVSISNNPFIYLCLPSTYLTFTSAAITGGTTLTITVASQSLVTSSGVTVYLVLPIGITLSSGVSAFSLNGTYTTQTGTNATTIVLTIASSTNGSLIFNTIAGTVDTLQLPSASLNSTYTTQAGTTGNQIVLTIASQASTGYMKVSSIINPTYLYSSLPSLIGVGYTIGSLAYPVNGRAIENASFGALLQSQITTVFFVKHTNRNFIRYGNGSSNQSPVIACATAVNGTSGADTTNSGQDFNIRCSYFSGASRTGLKRNALPLLTSLTDYYTNDANSSFRIASVILNSTSSAYSDVNTFLQGVAVDGWRYDSQFNNAGGYVVTTGGLTTTTLYPVHLRIGGDTSATTNYSTYPLNYWYEGGLGDVLIYNSILTLEQRQLVEGWLSQKYACQSYLGNGSTTVSPNTSATYTITSGSISGSGPYTITLGFSSATAFVNNTFVTISGVTNPATVYNAVWFITTSTTTSIQFSSTTNLGAWVAGGTIQGYTTNSATFVHPYALNPSSITGGTVLDVSTNYYTQGLVAWFDASNISTLTPNGGVQGQGVTNNSAISSWASVSGSLTTLALTQATTNYQPVFIASAQNGLPAIRFTYGGSPYTTNGNLVSATSNFNNWVTTSTNTEFTWFIALNKNSSTGIRILNLLTSVNSRICLNTTTFEQITVGASGGSFVQTSSSFSLTASTPYILSINRSKQTITIRIIGNGSTTVSTTVFTTNLNAFQGGSAYISLSGYSAGGDSTTFGGDIYEIMMYRYAMSITDIYKLEGYLAWKWGLSASLAPTHPYYKIMP